MLEWLLLLAFEIWDEGKPVGAGVGAGWWPEDGEGSECWNKGGRMPGGLRMAGGGEGGLLRARESGVGDGTGGSGVGAGRDAERRKV